MHIQGYEYRKGENPRPEDGTEPRKHLFEIVGGADDDVE